jgi:N-acetylneuraminic acid mutarotase
MKKQCLLLFILFCGLADLAWAQDSVYIGNIRAITTTYESKAKSATKHALNQAQITHALPGKPPLVLQITSSKQQGGATYYYGEVYNTRSSKCYLKIAGREVSGSVVMLDQKRYYRYSSTPDGSVYLIEEDIDKVLCIGIPQAHKSTSPNKRQSTPLAQTTQTRVAVAVPPILESLPGAGAVLYLDFDGQTVSGTLWNSSYTSGADIVAAPSTMTQTEMTEIWKLMSEDFRPFALNVTTSETVFNSASVNRRMRVIFTPTNNWYPSSAGGVAFIGSFTWGGTADGETPCWVWNTGGKNAGEAGSHESGHTMGLVHDGRTSPQEEYFKGQGSWAPIMGVGYSVPQVQWSKGEYAYANNTEDDLLKITTQNGFNYRIDDHGNNISSATPLVLNPDGTISAENNKGIINTTTDVDVFSFNTGGGTVGLSVNPDPSYSNLDVYLTLRNAAGTVIATADPATMEASINANLASGTYYLTVDGTKGALGANSEYGSLGAYSLATKDYCIPVYSDGCTTYATLVNNFSFNTLVNNNSGCGSGTAKGYTNYAPTGAFTTTVAKGQSYTMNMQATNYAEYFGVWIDYNRDKDFDDAGEFVFASTATSTSLFSASITIPTTATSGTTRMRIRSAYYSAFTATQSCAAIDFGEAEDYTITIGGNSAPTVSITAPANGATFTAPATINIGATAADSDGSIAKVEFLQGTTKLGEDLTAPYTYSWSSVAAGTYSLTAKATDNLGLSKTSAAVSITVSSNLPTITTFLPTSGPSGAGVMIKGTNLTSVTAVRFNGTAATVIYPASSTLLYATVPAGATTGKIQVVTQAGTVSSAISFTVAAIVTKWVSKTGITTGRILHGAIATGGKIYVFGGRSSSAALSSLEIYNPSTNAWSAGAALPVATSGMATALGSNSLIYKFGGVTSALVATVYRYTPATNTWATMASMPTAVSDAAAAATSNGKIYVFGGETSTTTGSSTNATRIYDIATNTWSSGANMPVALQQHSAVIGSDGKIYVIGGRSTAAGAPLGRVLIYNPATNAWTSGANMLIPKVQFGAVRAADGRIYVIGGKAADPNSKGPFFHTVEIYNPSTNTWATGPVIPVPNGQQAAVRLNDNLYALGGSDNTIRNYNIKLIPAPLAPASLTATTASASQINLKWTDKALNEANYVIERATVSTGPFTTIATLAANNTAYSNTGLVSGTTYYYRVKATNTGGSSAYSNVASATTTTTLTIITIVSANQSIKGNTGLRNTLSVHPNPVRTTAFITFAVKKDQRVRLEIYDASGHAISQIYSGQVEAGKTYHFQWQVAGQPAGLYFSKLITEQDVLSEKMVLQR